MRRPPQRALFPPLPLLLLGRMRLRSMVGLETPPRDAQLCRRGAFLVLSARRLFLTSTQWDHLTPRTFTLMLWILTLVMAFAVGVMAMFQVRSCLSSSQLSLILSADLAHHAR